MLCTCCEIPRVSNGIHYKIFLTICPLTYQNVNNVVYLLCDTQISDSLLQYIHQSVDCVSQRVMKYPDYLIIYFLPYIHGYDELQFHKNHKLLLIYYYMH